MTLYTRNLDVCFDTYLVLPGLSPDPYLFFISIIHLFDQIYCPKYTSTDVHIGLFFSFLYLYLYYNFCVETKES